MAIETNGINRVPLIKKPSEIFDIFNSNDLLKAGGGVPVMAPDGETRIPLTNNALYRIHETFIWPLMLYPDSTDLLVQQVVTIEAARAGIQIQITQSPPVAHFYGRKLNTMKFSNITIIDIGNSGAGQSAKVFDCVGGAATSAFTADNFSIVNVAEVGELTDIILSFNPTVNFVSVGRGLISDQTPFSITPSPHSVLGGRCINPFAIATQAPYYGFTGVQSTIDIQAGSIDFTSVDEFIRIDGNATGSYSFVGNAFNGIGTFLSAGNTATNTLYANADLVVDSFSDSTVDPGVDTTVNLAVITKFKRGQFILIADEAAYNGLHQIVRVADDQLSFDINVVFSTSGAATLKQTRITAALHKFILNENISITDTIAYNGTYVINQIFDNNNYEISFAFATAETVGTAISISKTQKDQGITSEINGEAPSSKRIATGVMNGNIQVTAFSTADEYIGMNLGIIINDSIVTERFTLVNNTIGMYRYDDSRPITVSVNALVWLEKSGATQNYRIALDKNGDTPIFTTTITTVEDVGLGIARFEFTPGPTLVVGQRVIIKNYVTNTNYNGTYIIDIVGSGFFEINSIAYGTNEAGGEFENAYSIAEVKTTSIMTAFLEFINLVQNDTLRIRIAPDGHTDSCTITDFKLAIVGL